MGFDFPIILDFTKIKFPSCDIKLRDLRFEINEDFFYDYDFGDHQRFALQIIKIVTVEKSSLPRLLSYSGQNIRQYPDTLMNTFIEFKKSTPSSTLFQYVKYIDYAKDYKNTIRFVHKDDFVTLKKWRKGNDKKKWEKAVVVLENLKKDVQTLSEKIERPVNEIQKWIHAFNANGLQGIITKRKKRDERKRNKKVKNRTKQIIEILHQKPKDFAINRGVWTLKMLAKVYQKKHGEQISGSSVARHLKILGYSIRKARSVLTSPNPNYREKVELLFRF